MVKNLPASAGDARDVNSIPGSGRSLGVGNDTSLQYFCLENPVNRGSWWATVHGMAKNQTRLSDWAHPDGRSKVTFQEAWVTLCNSLTPMIYNSRLKMTFTQFEALLHYCHWEDVWSGNYLLCIIYVTFYFPSLWRILNLLIIPTILKLLDKLPWCEFTFIHHIETPLLFLA